jgi:hypothetical protein
MIKPLSFQTTEDASHFEPVPADIGYQKAIDMLLKEDAGPQVARSSGKTS